MKINLSKINHLIIAVLIISLLSSVFCEFKYQNSPSKPFSTLKFQKKLSHLENDAENISSHLKNILKNNPVDSLITYPINDKNISFYIHQNGQLVYWSDNHIDLQKLNTKSFNKWSYSKLKNAYCITKSFDADSLILTSVITIKYNFPYENGKLRNNFISELRTNKDVQLKLGNKNDKNAIFDNENHYLFTLSTAHTLIYNDIWGYAGLICEMIFLLLFFHIIANWTSFTNRKKISLKEYLYIASCSGIITALSLYFRFPTLLYWSKLFSANQYFSNIFLASLSHLSVLTLYFYSIIFLLFFHVEIKQKKITAILLQVVFILYFFLLYNVLSGLILHSNIDILILDIKDLKVIPIWVHLLILVWGVGLVLLFYKTHRLFKNTKDIIFSVCIDILLFILLTIVLYISTQHKQIAFCISWIVLIITFYIPFLFKKHLNFQILAISWVLFYVLFFVFNTIVINHRKNYEKYRILAENIYINGNTEMDHMTDLLLEDMDKMIVKDKKLKASVLANDSINKLNEYLNDNYFRGFWNKYQMKLDITSKNSDTFFQYRDFINQVGNKIGKTHFYSVPPSYNDMLYLGIFPFISGQDTTMVYMEFYPRKNFSSYSFPNLLSSSTPSIQSQLQIAIAKYDNGKLTFASGKKDFPTNNSWLKFENKTFYHLHINGKVYFIYSPSKTHQIVIIHLKPLQGEVLAIYLIYILLIFYGLAIIFIKIYIHNRNKIDLHIGLTGRFQYAFIILLILSFFGIFYVSVNFIEKKYSDEQISNLENKKGYIQKALQDIYYWNRDISTVNHQTLNYDLQELSYRYHTDINVYDNNGRLIASSQPFIFSKNLISKQISPIPFFGKDPNIDRTEFIGDLKYLIGYTQFYNGDYLQIGYIAVPQFLSQEEMQNEIESFISVIRHIYLVIIILAIILTLLIGKQLSMPLNMIQTRLKEMQFGQKNEKIEYHIHDEVGQLVAQYNKTLDELDRSAQLLAQSERESAWKTMARQIAHEINNPLTPMKLTIQQLQRTKKLDKDKFDEYFEKSSQILIEQIDNLSRIAGTFSNFARLPEAKFNQTDIASKLFSVFQLFMHSHEEIQFSYYGSKNDIYIMADAELLTQVFNNILKNAVQSIPQERNGKIEVKISELSSNINIEISDNGKGIPDEIIDKLYLPNFTTKSTGMGLGLSISKNIIEIMSGSISFSTEINKGTTFRIKFSKES